MSTWGVQRENSPQHFHVLISRLQIAPAEIKEIIAAYNDKNDIKAVQSDGLHVAGERFVVLKSDDRSLYGKRVWPGSCSSLESDKR